jgi:hypothetical protein
MSTRGSKNHDPNMRRCRSVVRHTFNVALSGTMGAALRVGVMVHRSHGPLPIDHSLQAGIS